VVFLSINALAQNLGKKAPVKKECILLNDSAFRYITNYMMKNDKKDLDTALYLLKETIRCDSSYFIAYLNMSSVYDYMGNYKEQLQVVNKLFILSNNDPIFLTSKAEILKKDSQPELSKITYNKADSIYSVILKNNPKNVNLIVYYIYLKEKESGADAAQKELDRQIKLNPELAVSLRKKVTL
jgi:tetratricopeptide (TPR) repeat protein